MNVASYIDQRAQKHPDWQAIWTPARQVTYQDLADRSSRVARTLQASGLDRGSRVAVLAENCAEFFELLFGAAKAGSVLIPLNYRYSPPELQRILQHSQASAVFVQPKYWATWESIRGHLPLIQQVWVLGPDGTYEETLNGKPGGDFPYAAEDDDLLAIIYTSGSTGLAKGVMLTHQNLWAGFQAVAKLPGYLRPGQERSLFCTPLCHISAFTLTHAHLYSGNTIVLLERFEPDYFLDTFEEQNVTHVGTMVPTLIQLLLNHPRTATVDFSRLHTIFYAGAPMHVATVQRALEMIGPVLMQAYGLTETSTCGTCLTKEEHVTGAREEKFRYLLSSSGTAREPDEVCILGPDGTPLPPGDIGEVAVRAPGNMAGYWRDAETTAQVKLPNGWLLTGDLGRLDALGYLFLLDRKKDIINSGGLKISSREVEDVLYRHPAVVEAAVIPVPDETFGEAVKAVVVLGHGHSVSEAELIEHCKGTLAGFKKPKTVAFMTALPKLANGKIDKKALREAYWQGHERRVH